MDLCAFFECNSLWRPEDGVRALELELQAVVGHLMLVLVTELWSSSWQKVDLRWRLKILTLTHSESFPSPLRWLETWIQWGLLSENLEAKNSMVTFHPRTFPASVSDLPTSLTTGHWHLIMTALNYLLHCSFFLKFLPWFHLFYRKLSQ